MLHIIICADDLLAQETLEAVAGPLRPGEDTLIRFDGREVTPEALLQAALTGSFLGGRTIVIVRDLLKRFEGVTAGGRGRTRAAQLEGWIEAAGQLAQAPPSAVVVFLEQGPLRANALLEALRPTARVHDVAAPKEQDLVPWIVRRARDRGAGMDAEAAAELARLVGPNLALLATEIEKLALYADGRPITASDVQALVGDVREAKVWDLTQAAVEGRAADATRTLAHLLDEGESPQGLLALLGGELRRVALYLALRRERLPADELARAAGVSSRALPHLARRAERLAGRVTEAYDALLDADAAIKRGVLDEQTALYLLVHRIASLARA
ncbi:MAG TPA: DNA polymerase III subunit delta [Dehalococcoidia bacterium]|nr:DNA polymerase III subunit delta [Dehalococcoidia bacterium]